MLQIVLQSFIRAEVTIGVVLTALVLSGRNDPQMIGYTLGGLALFFVLSSLLPLSRSASKAPAVTKEEQALAELEKTTGQSVACCSKPLSRRHVVVRGLLMSAVMLVTAILIYWLAPV